MFCEYKCRLPHDNKRVPFTANDYPSPVIRTQCTSHDQNMYGIRSNRLDIAISSSLGKIANYIPNAGTRGINLIAYNTYKSETRCDDVVFANGDVIIPTRAFAVSEFERLDADMSQLQNPNFTLISKPFSRFMRHTLIAPQVVPARKPWNDTIDDVDASLQLYKSMYYSKPEYNIYRTHVCSMFEPLKRTHNESDAEIYRYLKSIRAESVGEDTLLNTIQKINETTYEEMSNNEAELEQLYTQLFNKYPTHRRDRSEDYIVANLDGNELTLQQKQDSQLLYDNQRGQTILSGQCLAYLSAFDFPIKEHGDKVKFRYSQNKPNVTFSIIKGFVATRNIVDGEELVLDTIPFESFNDKNKLKDYITHYAFYRLKFQMTKIAEKQKNELPRVIDYQRKEAETNYEIKYVKPW